MDTIEIHRAQIKEFFERSKGERRYKNELLVSPAPKRILIKMEDIRKYSEELSENLKNKASVLMTAFEEIASEIAQSPVHVGICGVLGGERTTPRDLLSKHLGKLVCVEGIITSASIVRPKIKKSVHYCGKNNIFMYKEYRDARSFSFLPPTSTAIPKYSMEGNRIDLEYGLSCYGAHQSGVIQEMPEMSPAGQMPRGLSLTMEDDLAGGIKPGDRVRVYGTYKCISHIKKMPDALKSTLIAHFIEPVHAVPRVSEVPDKIYKILEEEGVDGIIKNIAPSIYGHFSVKKALLFLMLGGSPVLTETGGKIRGDINMLMVGDPGIAKSQMLRYVLELFPLAISTTGRGASGVGLTAAVVNNPETGTRQVEAGAMVLADTGIVCIDEFDKMDETERAAIHEAMEQQSVTIAKGGIYVTLNARCSVLAAANPVSGQYRPSLTPRENIRLPESLLTRFDLIFIMEDTMEYDQEIAAHVLKRRMGAEAFSSPVTQKDMLGYIEYARKLQPQLTEEASLYISKEYERIREEGEIKRNSLARGVTARLLESLIRLSTASAKSRLSSVIELSDAEIAISLLEPTLWRQTMRKKTVKEEEAEPLELMEILSKYREMHPHDQIVSLDKIVLLTGKDKEKILEELEYLEKEEGVLMVTNGMVVFNS
ncbi:DNA replication licensing factor MCM3 [Nematocida sp. LUAm3]|nr:DNA replication licensing factor MCM3 [Nematocida sp. LUAm3]KAI5174544.1 DNA replication licensing factor MCM3 [Nematocida sp. LUAm2]KAI5178050.1 DNA replication licensing factor MCM3 [Nematocida sp. LUAm1]